MTIFIWLVDMDKDHVTWSKSRSPRLFPVFSYFCKVKVIGHTSTSRSNIGNSRSNLVKGALLS